MSSQPFTAVAFVENLPLRQLVAAFPEAPHTAHGVRLAGPGEAMTYLFPFGAAVFQNADAAAREAALARLKSAFPKLKEVAGEETLRVVEESGAPLGVENGVFTLDRLTPRRASVVALILAQSAAMSYYETILEEMFARTNSWVERMQRSGSAPLRARPLHRFIAEAVGVRTEVLSVLHLLDKPDEIWEDPALEEIYGDFRAEFGLGDRYHALELKLRSVQESLELVLDVVRDRRMMLLELVIVALIAGEILMSLLK